MHVVQAPAVVSALTPLLWETRTWLQLGTGTSQLGQLETAMKYSRCMQANPGVCSTMRQHAIPTGRCHCHRSSTRRKWRSFFNVFCLPVCLPVLGEQARKQVPRSLQHNAYQMSVLPASTTCPDSRRLPRLCVRTFERLRSTVINLCACNLLNT